MKTSEEILLLMANGSVSFVYSTSLGHIAIPQCVLDKLGLVSGDQLSDNAARAITQLYEPELKQFIQSL